MTSADNKLSECFTENGDLETESQVFKKTFFSKFRQSFTRVRVNNTFSKSEAGELIQKRNKIRQEIKTCSEERRRIDLEEEVSDLEKRISDIVEDSNMKKFLHDFGPIMNDESSSTNESIWKIKRKVFRKNSSSVPSAMLNENGRLVSEPKELKNATIKHFTERFRNRPILPGYESLKYLKDELCHVRLQYIESLPFEPWKMDQLEKVLKSLKKGKSKDPYGLIGEFFRIENIGEDLKISLLKLFNNIKENISISRLLTQVDIIPIWKGRGDRRSLENQRGIAIVNKFKDILMKIIYLEEYENIDENMSDSNIGARKNLNIRNHIFIINSIINESLQQKTPIDVIISDYRQCFDVLWNNEVTNDLFENGVTNRNLNIIHKANETNHVAVVTSVGKTEAKEIKDTILQGETMAPIACSSLVDSVGKECTEEGKYLYMYRNTVGVPPLTMIDDSIAVGKCGMESILVNEYLNTKTNIKKLQYNEDKCYKMHVGREKEECPKVTINTWRVKNVKNIVTSKYEIADEMGDITELNEAESQRYLGDIVQSNGKNDENIRKRREKGFIIINQIKKILENGFFGKHYFQAAVILRESLFLNSVLLNSGVWTNVTNKEIHQLSTLDNTLVRNIFECPSFTSVPMMFLDLGIVPLKFFIISRRIMFLFYLLNQDTNTVLYKCFLEQSKHELPGDWILQVRNDLEMLKINYTFEEIKSMSKSAFKKYVKNKIKMYAFQYLQEERRKQNKCRYVDYNKFEMQDYLKSDLLTTYQKKLCFQLRTSSYPVYKKHTFLKGRYPLPMLPTI